MAFLLRFVGGPCDGLEEVAPLAADRLYRSPAISEMVRAMATADPEHDLPAFSVEYRLVSLHRERDVAEYRVRVAGFPHDRADIYARLPQLAARCL